MKAKTILEYIDSQRISELREIIVGEICKKKNRKKPTYKAIQKLALQTEKEMRIPRSQNKVTFKWQYTKPHWAGAYYLNDKTMICNGYYGLIFNDKIQGLKMVEDNSNPSNLERLIPNIENWTKVKFDLKGLKKELIDKPDLKTFNLANREIKANLFIMIYECFDKAEIYQNDKDLNNSPLVIKGSNGIGILFN